MAEEGGGDHAPGDGFAVLIASVPGDAFEGVREGMAEIEDFTEPGFAFIAADDTGLDYDVARNEQVESSTIATQDFLHRLFEHGEHRSIGDDGMLDDLGEAAAKFAVRKSAQQFRIGEDEARRIERADEVFPFGEINSRLATNGTIHLGDERGRHVYQGDATQINGGDEPGDVSDDSAADCNKERFAVRARFHQ